MINAIHQKFFRFAAAVLSLVVAAPAYAQYSSDIDIYSGSAASAAPPNILFVVDNTANWNSAFTNEIAALVNTFNSLPANKFRIGLMMFTETGAGNSGNDGAYVRSAVRLLDTNYQTKLAAMLNSLNSNGDKSNGGKAGLTMAEAYYYFAGKAPYAGNDKVKTDYVGNTSGTTASNAIYAIAGNALASKSGSPYVKPVLDDCQRNYIIYISNGAVQDNSSDTSTASTKLSAAYTALTMTRPSDMALFPSGSQDGVADEWARFMKKTPENISTFTLDVDKITTGQGPGWSAMLKSMATNSGGEYFSVSSGGSGTEILDALAKILNQIQAVNSVFSSASLPVSVNARGTYLNQIFMGMFRPDAVGLPRWRGNLKQYKFGYEAATDTLFLSDQNNNPAISGTTGFISPSAVSYWTSPSTFWANQQMGTPLSGSDSPDGEVVEKGGVAQQIRTAYATSQATRNVFTCISCAANTTLGSSVATQFTDTNAAITFGADVTTSADRSKLITWVRGTDNNSPTDEAGPGGTTTVRPSVHGDVLHSRPAVVNYGGTRGVVVFYGSNDGTLRAVNGNTNLPASPATVDPNGGKELWSFIPEEHFSKLNRLRTNSPEIQLSTTIVSATITPSTPKPRDYFVDGPIGVYQKVLTGGVIDKVYLYVAMRRGGRVIYALDVTDPSAPKFLWKKTGGPTGDISILGQTWSEPKVAKIQGNANPVIIMGAGYDATAEDVTPQGATTMGNAVLVLDAFTGAVLKTFSTTRSVPSDVSLIDSDFDGYVDRVYAVDVGGNVYRIDLEKTTGSSPSTTSTAVADWGIYQLAALSGTGTRKFFYPPDVVITPSFSAVMVGSGDREKPLATTSTDAFFTIKDTRSSLKGTPTTAFTAITAADLGTVGGTGSTAAGCQIPMSTSGEKIVNAPVSVGGITYFSTNMPRPASTTSCSANLGIAKVYSAPLFCGVATSQVLVGGGLPPSPVTGTVTVSYTSPITGETVTKQVPFIIGAPNSKGSGIEGSKVTPVITPVRKRRYWFLENTR